MEVIGQHHSSTALLQEKKTITRRAPQLFVLAYILELNGFGLSWKSSAATSQSYAPEG
jgi:hypothetical protein